MTRVGHFFGFDFDQNATTRCAATRVTSQRKFRRRDVIDSRDIAEKPIFSEIKRSGFAAKGRTRARNDDRATDSASDVRKKFRCRDVVDFRDIAEKPNFSGKKRGSFAARGRTRTRDDHKATERASDVPKKFRRRDAVRFRDIAKQAQFSMEKSVLWRHRRSKASRWCGGRTAGDVADLVDETASEFARGSARNRAKTLAKVQQR